MSIDATYYEETSNLKAGARVPMPTMSIESMQLRAALEYWMALCDRYEKRLYELEEEITASYREVDRQAAVIAAYAGSHVS
jgi:hypothetical protein